MDLRVRARLVLVCLGLLVAALPSLRATPALAAGSTAFCVHQWKDTITPGATTRTKHALVTSGGETGTIQCSGDVAGEPVAGPGSFGEDGSVDGSCSSGTGHVVFSITIPTDAGRVHLSFPVSFSFGPGAGVTRSDVFPGAFVVRPVTGDCVGTPVTEIAVTRAGVLQT